MYSLLRLPEPCQPVNLPVPFGVFFAACFVLLSLPSGSNANTYGEINGPLVSATTGQFQAELSMETLHLDTSFSGHSLATRPTSLARNVNHLRLLERQAHLPNFANSASSNLSTSAGSSSMGHDPRLQRTGKTWSLSDSFVSKVGADPWALKGVGFPNIETHDDTITSNYKPYEPLVDWKPVDANNGQWKPIPAVHCMGLTAQQIAERAQRHEREILSYSIQYGVSASLIKAVITKESCFNTNAVSKVGAEGLMQLMPETAQWLKVTDRADVNQNLSAGIRYLADLRKRFGTEELALAAYNAGPGNVERHGGIPPFEETQQYVKSVMTFYQRYAAATRFANQRVSN